MVKFSTFTHCPAFHLTKACNKYTFDTKNELYDFQSIFTVW